MSRTGREISPRLGHRGKKLRHRSQARQNAKTDVAVWRSLKCGFLHMERLDDAPPHTRHSSHEDRAAAGLAEPKPQCVSDAMVRTETAFTVSLSLQLWLCDLPMPKRYFLPVAQIIQMLPMRAHIVARTNGRARSSTKMIFTLQEECESMDSSTPSVRGLQSLQLQSEWCARSRKLQRRREESRNKGKNKIRNGGLIFACTCAIKIPLC